MFGRKPSIADRELAELTELYDRVAARTIDEAQGTRSLLNALGKVMELSIREPLLKAFDELVKAEQVIGDRPDFAALDFKQQLELKKRLRAIESRDGKLTEEVLSQLFGSILSELPKAERPSPFTIPLINTLANPREWISRAYVTLVDDKYLERDVLAKLRNQLYLNLCHVSGVEPGKQTSRPLKHALKSELSGAALSDAYLRKTPFHALMKTPVSLRFTREDRMGHMHIVGGTGSGKTTLLEQLIRYDLASDDPPAIVVIDPHADLIQKLSREKLGIENRVIIIDPRDVKHPPALNVFAVNRERLAQYDEATREQVTAGVIQTFDYLFSGLFGADLTAKQGVFFRYVARLMLALPETLGRNATILDMLRLMEEPPKGTDYAVPPEYQEAVASLPDIPRNFFERDFSSKTFQQTKEQIRYRLQAIIENPTLARLFTAEDTKLDLFTEINSGSIILVDTAKDFLKGSSSHFGRIFISLVLQAVLERAAIHPSKRKDAFLIVDEAASVFDTNIDDLLTEARKYRCGLVLAHQYLDQASHSLRASLAANTNIKFASGLSAGDARAMAPEMRTTADFILDQPKLQFAAHIRHVTPSAVSIPIELIRDREYLDHETYEAMRKRNREAVSLAPTRKRPMFVPAEIPPAENEDISDEW